MKDYVIRDTKDSCDAGTELSNALSKLKTDNSLCDVTIVCGGKEFPAHSLVLSARSDVFATMLDSDMAEGKSGRIEVDDINVSTMDNFLR